MKKEHHFLQGDRVVVADDDRKENIGRYAIFMWDTDNDYLLSKGFLYIVSIGGQNTVVKNIRHLTLLENELNS